MIFQPIYDVKKITDLKDMINQSAIQYGDKNAFLVKVSDDNYRGVTYREFKKDMDALGTAFNNLGLKDQFIAVISENRYEWCVTYLSVVNGTGVIVPLDKELPVSEIQNLLTRANVKALVYSSKHEKDVLKLSETLNIVDFFINMDSKTSEGKFLSFSELVKTGNDLISSGDNSYLDAEIDNNRLSMLIFTSGTTDLAKGVMLSHKNICTNLMSICQSIYISSKDSSMSILPIHHTFECTTEFLIMMYNGCTLSFNEGLKHVAKNLKETAPTILYGVPLLLENMYKKIWENAGKKRGQKTKLKIALKLSDFLFNYLKIDIRRKLFKQIHDAIGGNIRLIISGAAAIDPKVSKGFTSMGIKVLQGYGLTECSPVVSVCREMQAKSDSIGQPLPGIDLRIDNPNSEGIGEIAVKGDNVMLGYFNNPQATEKIIKDGWLYTGDLGWMDKDGLCYITGRKKNVIVTKNGKNIFPEEVEAYLNKSQLIEESLVWGKYDDESGETYVNAQIYPNIDAIKEKLKLSEITNEEIFKAISTEVKGINRNMPLYKRIRKFKLRENEFEKTTTKKIKRYIESDGKNVIK